eukprot:UN33325
MLKNESDKAKRFKFFRDQKTCIIGRLLIRYVLGKILGLSWNNIETSLKRNKNTNRPYIDFSVLKSDSLTKRYESCPKFNFDFNISHDSEWITIVADSHGKVGCDIQKIKLHGKLKNTTDLVKEYVNLFQKREQELIKSFSTPEKQLWVLTKLWTLKESFVK